MLPAAEVRALVVVAPRDLEPECDLRVAGSAGSVAWATSASHASATNETYSIAPSFADVGSMVISITFPLVMASLRAIGAMSPEVVEVVSVPSLGTRERAAAATSGRPAAQSRPVAVFVSTCPVVPARGTSSLLLGSSVSRAMAGRDSGVRQPC